MAAHQIDGNLSSSSNRHRTMRRSVGLLVVAAVLGVGCANAVPESGGEVPTTVAQSDLPIALVVGEPCEDSEACSPRPIELFGRLYFGADRLARARVGEIIAVPAGIAVDGLQIRAINDVDPERAFVVTGEGRIIYEQAPSIGVDGPLLVATNEPGIGSQDGGGEGFMSTFVVENGCLRLGGALVTWEYNTRWDEQREQLIDGDGNTAHLGDTLQTGGFGIDRERVVGQGDDNVADYLQRCQTDEENVFQLNGGFSVTERRSDLSGSPLSTYEDPDPEVSAEEALIGRLSITGDCVEVANPDNPSEVFTPIWPHHDVMWDASSDAITHNGETYRNGDSVLLSGNAVAPEAANIELGWEPNPTCGQRPMFFIGF